MDLSGTQIKAIGLLVAGQTCRSVAEEVDVTPQTISAWKNQPYFAAELNKAKMDALESARSKIQGGSIQAVESLLELAQNASSEEVKRKAALDLVKLAGLSVDTLNVFAWGIGPSSAEEVEQSKTRRLRL